MLLRYVTLEKGTEDGIGLVANFTISFTNQVAMYKEDGLSSVSIFLDRDSSPQVVATTLLLGSTNYEAILNES